MPSIFSFTYLVKYLKAPDFESNLDFKVAIYTFTVFIYNYIYSILFNCVSCLYRVFCFVFTMCSSNVFLTAPGKCFFNWIELNVIEFVFFYSPTSLSQFACLFQIYWAKKKDSRSPPGDINGTFFIAWPSLINAYPQVKSFPQLISAWPQDQ